jgi:hypothetical protein
MDDALKLLIAAGKAVLPQIVPGAAVAIQVGKGIIDALDAAKDLGTPGDQSDNAVTRDALREKILEHFDATISGLRGGD